MHDDYLTGQLSRFSATLSLSAVPADVQRAARRALVDTLSVITAGGCHPLLQKVHSELCSEPGPAVIVGGRLVAAAAAAFANGLSAHVHDFDDTSFTGIMHGSAVILPAVLAAAAEQDTSWDDILLAFVIGSEVAYTIGDHLTHVHYFRGWFVTGILGLIGAAAAVSKLYSQNVDEISVAISLAAAGAGISRSIVGTDAKPFFVGDSARRAIEYAKAAGVGVTAPKDVFESPHGFASLLNDGILEMKNIPPIGTSWRLVDPGLSFKRYPICSATHTIIDQTAALVKEAGCTPDDIERIHCSIPELTDISLVYDHPQSVQEAQFSISFPIACAVRYGTLRLEHLDDQLVSDFSRIGTPWVLEKTIDPELSSDDMKRRYPESARVNIRLKDGREFSGFCGETYGMPNRPLSNSDLMAKASQCLAYAGIVDPNSVELFATLLDGNPSKDCVLPKHALARLWSKAQPAQVK
jgi:2-methylcitrate dehydratase PrpD